jgi:hypothetical protein
MTNAAPATVVEFKAELVRCVKVERPLGKFVNPRRVQTRTKPTALEGRLLTPWQSTRSSRPFSYSDLALPTETPTANIATASTRSALPHAAARA